VRPQPIDSRAREEIARLWKIIDQQQRNNEGLKSEVERLQAECLGRALEQNKVQAEVERLRTALLKRGISSAPCDICGYNGSGYYQPRTHPCVALAAAKPKRSICNTHHIGGGTYYRDECPSCLSAAKEEK
jgi:hypothetical protein